MQGRRHAGTHVAVAAEQEERGKSIEERQHDEGRKVLESDAERLLLDQHHARQSD